MQQTLLPLSSYQKGRTFWENGGHLSGVAECLTNCIGFQKFEFTDFSTSLQHGSCSICGGCLDKKYNALGIAQKIRVKNPTKFQTTIRRQFVLSLPVVYLTQVFGFWLGDQAGMAAVELEHGPGGSRGEKVLDGDPFTTRIMRPAKDQIGSADEFEEILAVKLKVPRGKFCGFKVFLDFPTATEGTSVTCSEYAGQFYHEARRVSGPEQTFQKISFRIGIGQIIQELGLDEQPSVVVTFVPTGVSSDFPITIEEMKIELE